VFLPPSGVDNYTLTITTIPALSGWEASFDGGVTWVPGVPDVSDPATFRWLLVGPLVAPGDIPADPHTVITLDVEPLVRAIDDPKIIVRKAPYVSLSTPTA
jgi:hypothetical protein